MSALSFAQFSLPGGSLWAKSTSDPALQAAVQRDLQAVMSSGISFHGGQSVEKNLNLSSLLEYHVAVYLAEARPNDSNPAYPAWLGGNWREAMDSQTHQVAGHPGVFIGEEFLLNGTTVVAPWLADERQPWPSNNS